MPAPKTFDYAVVRVVPRVDREEFINAGVVLYCRTERILVAQVALNEGRLLPLDPSADVVGIRSHLNALQRLCVGGPDAGPLGRLSQSERFLWLVSPRSTVIQTSPVHSGLCDDPQLALQHLFERMVTPSL